MRIKSVVSEGNEIRLATELINFGARLQVLEAETGLSRERLLKLHKELKGVSPSKGMLPFSADWFLSWQPNVHASMFIDIRNYLLEHTDLRGTQALVTSYRLYLEHTQACGLEPILTLTRAWTLMRFLGSLLQPVACTRCGGNFIGDSLKSKRSYVCGLCRPPSRAGTSNKRPQEILPRRLDDMPDPAPCAMASSDASPSPGLAPAGRRTEQSGLSLNTFQWPPCAAAQPAAF